LNKRPSLRDIATLTDVSISTVSLVLNDRPGISEDTRLRVWEAAGKLGYRAGPTPVAASPVAAAPVTVLPVAPPANTIGLLIEHGSQPAMLDAFYGDIIRTLQAEAQRLGYRVLLHMYERAGERLETVQADLAAHVQGLIIANDGDITPQMVAALEAARLPLVLIESHIEGHRLPCVLGDNFAAGYTVMRHLLALGHRDIAILRGPAKYSSLVDRLYGCLAALGEAGVRLPDQFLPEPLSEGPQKGYLQMKRVLALAPRPTAVVAISDKTAFGAMSAILEAGLSIPRDIAIVGIDNVTDSLYAHPPLTTYHIPRREMGVLAMRKLHRIISGEPEIAVKSVVYGELIVRESCGAVV
jgi:LacI family transcriptional regulator